MIVQADMKRALQALRQGKAVIFPTDTVVGLGVSVEHAQGPDEIYRIKQREIGKPIAWLVDGVQALNRYGRNVPDTAFALASEQWPGALTLVLQASDAVPASFRSRQGTIGLRMPDSPVALELLDRLGCPIAASSANIAGGADAADARQVDESVLAQAAYVLGGQLPASGRASTVIDCTGPRLRVLRQGDVASPLL